MAAPCQNFLLGISSFDAHNILGLVFSIQAGLFVYDIFWVFFTPVMVSVAKSFDAPIKLLFPTSDFARPFSILGLGDIVIPGIFVVLALRCDFSRGKDRQYFKSAFLGYIYCWSDRHNHRNELVSSCTSD
ncbi:COMPASS (complex proteins associated with Set1p) component [Salvia divinorum]|uniref:COMPASS (Complex proteins associated with Set1p) component n=1 Tax=Salvia divinorum TaxID=28513 RepID=A0ABD1H967_SALDI